MILVWKRPPGKPRPETSSSRAVRLSSRRMLRHGAGDLGWDPPLSRVKRVELCRSNSWCSMFLEKVTRLAPGLEGAQCQHIAPHRWVSTIMRAAGNSPRMALIASMPLRFGIRRSISVMSGRDHAIGRDRFLPILCLGHDGHPGLRVDCTDDSHRAARDDRLPP